MSSSETNEATDSAEFLFGDWNQDVAEDLQPIDVESLVVFSRDWTVETIVNQIAQGNIELNPDFQRRNAWDDGRRSKLIESLIAGLPVPEIVLAEDPARKRAFIVIDGKQRLLTIAGYFRPEMKYWKKPALSKLTVRRDLNGVTYRKLQDHDQFADEHRQLINADVRCTVISNFKSTDVLYDIFYRLNTGSVPLSTQELRQVLHKGPFANYLISSTNEVQALHSVLKLKGPDTRLRDVEMLLRFLALVLFGKRYRGNLKIFLDETMREVNQQWDQMAVHVQSVHHDLERAIAKLGTVFGTQVGKKFVDGRWENRFNKVLFEVEAYYFRYIEAEHIENADAVGQFLDSFKLLCSENEEFRASIEATTKTNERYHARFSLFQQIVNEAFGTQISDIPVYSQVHDAA